MKLKLEFGARLAEVLLRHRLIVVLLSIGLTVLLGAGASRLQFNNDYRYFFGSENPQLREYDRIEKVYSRIDSAIIVVEPVDGVVFKRETLGALEELTARGWHVPFATRVNSITNFQHTESHGDDIVVRDVVKGAERMTAAQVDEARAIVLREPLLKNLLITERADVTAVVIETIVPNEDPNEIPEIANYVRKMAADFERDFPGHKTYLSGDVFMSTSFFEAGAGDMSTLTPIMYLVLIVLLVVLLRSVFGMLAALTIVLCSMVCAMGFAGWVGIPLTPPGAMAPTVVMTLAIADSIHFLITVIHEMSRGRSKREAIVESLRLNLLPIVVTSVTTAIGFLCLNFNDSPPFHDLGNITAAGVMAAMVFSLSLLPVLADLFPIRVSRRSLRVEQAIEAGFGKLGPFVTARARYFIVAIPIVALALLAAIPSMRINDNFRTIFDHSFQFRRDSDYMLENLTGIWRIEFSVPSGGPGGVSDPVYLAKLAEFSDYLRGDERVLNVSSFSDVMKRINRSMHGDRAEYYRVPDDQHQAAQYLLLYELSLPLGLDLNNMIDVDRSSTRVNATTGDLGSGALIELTGRAEAWLAANAPEYMQTVGSGAVMMFAHITERNIYGMLKGMGIAAVLLTLIMIAALGSVKYGLLSLVPNLIPACMAFGIWSLAVGEVGFAISVVGSATLGIIVDDTVHFLSKYVKMRRETGASAEQALAHCFRGVGPAICATTILLVAGFGVMSLSHFGLNSTLGFLTMLTISIALFLDLLLLPSILYLIDGRQESPAPAGASLASPLLEREAK